MIEVPYWWDRRMSSLAATVYNIRPDLFKEKPEGIAISATAPGEETAKSSNSKTFYC